MKPKAALRAFLFGGALLAVSPLLHAAALYWDGSDSTADADGGAGTWTAADAWDSAATAGVNATWSTGSQAVFGGTSATVTLDSGITINNLASPATNAIAFSKSGYVIDAATAQTITLGNASVISGNNWTFNSNISFILGANNLTTSNAGTSAINGVISGTGLFIKGGGGEMVLSGLNTYTGKTNINQGTLTVNTLKDLSASSSLGAPTTAANGTIILGTGLLGGTLKYTGTGGADGTTNRVIDLATTSSGAVIDHSGTGLLKFTSAFTATGRGSKTLTLTGSTAGTAEIAGAIVNAASGGTALAATFASGASTVTLASVDGISTGASITGTGIDPGTTITAINTGTKTVTLSTNATGASGAVGSTYNVTGVLNLTSLTKDGSGTWTLSATNSFTGGLLIKAGTLKLGANNVIADAVASFSINGGTFDLAAFGEGVTPAITMADGVITGTSTGFLLARGGYAGNGTNTISKRLSVRATDANSGLFDISSGTTTVSGVIYSDNSTVQGIIKTGAGTLILSNPSNAYTGATAINGGTLVLDATGSIASSSSVAIGAGAILDTTAQTTHTISATQPVTFGITAAGSGSSGKIASAGLNVSNAVVTYNITGTPDDPVYILATYTGTLTGTFATVDPAPAGYTLNYAYEGNKIALVQNVSNTPPAISDIANQSLPSGGNTGALPVTVGDAETAVGSLIVTGTSSNTTLVPNGNIIIGGSGASRTVTVTPVSGLSGTATITIIVDDGSLTASDTFGLTVTDNYLSWSNANSVTGGENGDSDNDGVKNLVEYGLADDGERGVLSGNTITFTKRGAPYGTDITYTIEISTDLGITDSWDTAVSGVTDNSTAISYTFTPGIPVKNFARLKISRP